MSTATLVADVSAVPAKPALPLELDEESREWLGALRGDGLAHDAAVARLHALLLRAARFEVSRRRATLPHLRGDDLDDLAQQAADDALVSVLRRLDDFRGASRFTTWAYKFALLEAAVKLRKRAWQGREIPLEDDAWNSFSDATLEPGALAEQSELRRDAETRHRHRFSRHTNAASSSRSRSTACRSTCSPSGSIRLGARCTRHCTTRVASCARTSKRPDSRRT